MWNVKQKMMEWTKTHSTIAMVTMNQQSKINET